LVEKNIPDQTGIHYSEMHVYHRKATKQ